MVIEFKNTPEGYKSTEFGDIPLDWSIKNIGEIGEVYGGLSGKSKEDFEKGNSKFISYKNVFDNFFIDTNKLLPVNIKLGEKQNKVQEGDIIFTGSSETANEAGMSSVLINKVNHDIYLNSFCFGLRTKPNILNPYFSGYMFRSFNFRKEIFSLAQGSTRFNISKSNFLKLKVIIPPIKEQQKIAEILLAADEQIEKTEQLIEKTKELKKGLMQQLLTKGIGHNEFKETELGNIPSEWGIIKIDDIFHTIDGDRGKNYPNDKDFLAEGYCIFLDTKNVTKKGFSFKTKKFISKEKDATLSNGKLSRNDIVMTSRGTIGNIAYYDDSIPYENLRINSAMLILRSKLKSPVYKFWIQMLRGRVIEEYVRKSKVGSAQPHITKKSFKELKVAIPHKTEEQQKIADILSSVDNQIEIYEKEKEKQVELKKALMQQLLTGKIRVTV